MLDEAQALPDESLEALRLFTNLETENRKLLQVVLFGQPELDERLRQQAFRQLRQRITFSYRLRPLTLDETKAYVGHRLGVAGYQGQPLFSPYALKLLHKVSRGIPRLINIIAHKALLLSYGSGDDMVNKAQLKLAIMDTEDAELKAGNLLSLSILLMAVLLVAAGIYWGGWL